MKRIVAFSSLLVIGSLAGIQAGQPQPWQKSSKPQDSLLPVPIYNAPGTTGVPVITAPSNRATPVFTFTQSLWAQQHELVSDAKAQAIIDEFSTNYVRLGKPRVRVDVNPTSASAASKTERTSDERQMARDVEKLMGRPLRSAGVVVVEPRNGTITIGTAPTEDTTAEITIEVLISNRPVNVTEVDGLKTYTVPEIHMTAVRVRDSRIIGQANSSDVINKAGGPAYAASHFTAQDITEVTTLALMDDMVQEAK